MSVCNEEKETLRTEAFSDGVFAIAITLLVLDIKVPELDSLVEKGGLAQALLAQWPVYLAFMISFVNLLIIWVCHHNIFSLIRKTDGSFLYINGFLLLTVTVFPFTSSLLGEYTAQIIQVAKQSGSKLAIIRSFLFPKVLPAWP